MFFTCNTCSSFEIAVSSADICWRSSEAVVCYRNERRDYIVSKYEEKMFCRLHPLHNDESAMNDVSIDVNKHSDEFNS